MSARAAAPMRTLRGNHELRLLKGGEQLFPALIEAIDAAREAVLLETYIFEFARSVLPVAEALERAALRGVLVQVVVDGVGTGDVPPEWQQRWQAAGVQWRVFNPARGWRLLVPKRWRRMHRKLCVVDSQLGFCGGINLLDDYFDPNHGELDRPRFDFAVRVRGPLVADMHDTMARLWARLQVAREAGQRDVRGTWRAMRMATLAGTDMRDADIRAAPEELRSGATAALVLRDNVRFRRSIEGTYRIAIAQAKSCLLYTSPSPRDRTRSRMPSSA